MARSKTPPAIVDATAGEAEVVELRAEPAPASHEVFLTPQELSKRWKWAIRPRTLQNWRSSGRGPKYFKVGGGSVVLYRLEDVEEFERASNGKIVPGS